MPAQAPAPHNQRPWPSPSRGSSSTDTGADDAIDAVLRAVPSSAPDSNTRVEASDDGIGWSGPACLSCGTEMNIEIVSTQNGLKGYQRCPHCDLALLMPDLFAM